MQKIFKRIADSETFQGWILTLIILNAFCMGAEATPELYESYSSWLWIFFMISQGVFVAEMVIRLLAHAPRFSEFFKDSWNTFDFVVVALSLVPAVGGFTLIARLLRVFRILRVFSVSDTLRTFFDGKTSPLKALALTVLMLSIMSYIFALTGFHLFGESAGGRWGSLALSLSSVGYLATLKDLSDFIRFAKDVSVLTLLYFALFYLVMISLIANWLRTLLVSRNKGSAS